MKNFKVIDLGLTDYSKTLKLQRKLFKQRHLDEVDDMLIITQHLPVYTCGKNADQKSLIKTELPESIKLLEVDRGGSITFHGPGQMIIYPIIKLKDTNIISYLRKLEQVAINVLAIYGVRASTNKNTGVWVSDKKIASIGVKISSGVSMHGLALNVNCDLDYFEPILACGLKAKATSMKHILGYEVDVESIKDLVVINFGKIFNCKINAWEGARNEKLEDVSC